MTPPPGPAPVDPAALLRTRSYVQLLSWPQSSACRSPRRLRLPLARRRAPGRALHRPSRPARLRRRAGLVAAAGARGRRRAHGARRSSGCRAPAGTRPPTGFKPAGAAAADRAARRRARRRSRTLSFGAVLGPEAPLIADRQRPRRARRAPRRARRAADGRGGDRGRRAASRRSARCSARRCSARSCCSRRPGSAARCSGVVLLPGPAGGRHRHADLPRARLAHRLRDVLARDPEPAAVRPPHGRDVRLGARRSGSSRRCSAAASGGSRVASGRVVERRMLLLMPLLGLGDRRRSRSCFGRGHRPRRSEVLFSGQDAAAGAGRAGAATGRSARCCCWSPARALAYALSLSAFRGGPVFPAMFIGAAGGIAASHLPGLALDPRRGDGHRRDVHRDARRCR